jgi:putative transposase
MALTKGHFNPDSVQKIRESSNKGLALGRDRFKEEVEALSGGRVRPLKRGPKPKKSKLTHEFVR